jgi:uncharacterized membrane protein YfcA
MSVPPPSPVTPPTAGSPRSSSTWTLVLLLVFAFGLLIAIVFGASALGHFADAAYARGIITVVIILATIAIAFVLVYQAFFAETSDDNRFRRGREIFTGLMGVLGTIVGFYFGAADGLGNRLTLAALRLDGTELVTFVSGGASPYRYTVNVAGTASAQRLSTDGWIVDTLATAPAAGSKITVDVLDSRNQAASQALELPATEAKDTTPKDSAAQK